MNKDPTVGCKILAKKWKAKDQEIHKRRLREIKSAVDSKKPNTIRASSQRNLKREAMLERKFLSQN